MKKAKSHESCKNYMHGGKCWRGDGLEKVDDECERLEEGLSDGFKSD